MRVAGEHHRTIRLAEDGFSIDVIDQRRLPHAFERVRLSSMPEVARAIREDVDGFPFRPGRVLDSIADVVDLV